MAYTPVPSKLDDAAFGIATDYVSPSGYLVDEVASDSADEGDIGIARMNAKRILLSELRTPTGDTAMDDTNDAVRVNIVAGAPGSPSAVTIADGADVAQGTTTNAAITSDTNGTVIGFLRGLVKMIGDVWIDAANALGVNLRNASGTEIGTNTNPVRVDPTGTTAQPITDNGGSLTVDGSVTVSGTVSATQGTSPWVTSGTSTVSGTVSATQGTSPWVVGDGGGLISVDDGGGSLTVDGSVTVSGTATVSGTVSVDNITTSVTPGTAAANLGKAEDAAHTTGDVGVQMLSVRNDNNSASFLAGSDGDYQALQSDNIGSLKVVVTGGATKIDKTAFVEGTGAMTPIGGVLNDTISADPTEDQAAALRITAKRGLHINARDSAGVEALVPGTGATHLGKAEDAAHTSGDVGVMTLAVRADTAGTLAGTNGDYAPLQVDSNGRLRIDAAGADTVVRDGYTAQMVYDNTCRMVLQEILLRLIALEDRMFAT